MEEQTISGILFHPASNEGNGEHAHEMYLITWDGRVLHVHDFAGETSFDVGHRHGYAGTTEAAPSGIPHTHRYHTVSTFDEGHRHVIRGTTGPDIPVPGGGHYHLFEGVTTLNGRTPHTHSYRGRTSSA